MPLQIGEWIPFGSNQIVSLNERLGALDRCQVRLSLPVLPITHGI
jgi:hypothetical protein